MFHMKQVLIIHGYNEKLEWEDVSRPTPSNDYWLPWLQRQLSLQKIASQTPEMPGFYEPNYNEWKKTLEMFHIDSETALVGHSCGGGFLVRWLSENDISVGKVILVAPWLNPENSCIDFDPKFFNFEINPNIADRTKGISVLYSTDDFSEVITSVNLLKEKLKNVTGVNFLIKDILQKEI